MTTGPYRSLILSATLAAAGCSGGVTETELPATQQQLQYIGMAYQQAATDLGRSPANIKEFRPNLASYGEPQDLTKTTTVQQIEIVRNANTPGARRGAMPVVAYARGEQGSYDAVDFQLALFKLSVEQVSQLKP